MTVAWLRDLSLWSLWLNRKENGDERLAAGTETKIAVAIRLLLLVVSCEVSSLQLGHMYLLAADRPELLEGHLGPNNESSGTSILACQLKFKSPLMFKVHGEFQHGAPSITNSNDSHSDHR